MRTWCEVRNFAWHRRRIWAWQFFKFGNPTLVQTPATIINPTLIYPCFYLRNDHTDPCFCLNWKGTPGPCPVFPKVLSPGPDSGPKEKRRILPESTPVFRIRYHIWSGLLYISVGHDPVYGSLSNRILQFRTWTGFRKYLSRIGYGYTEQRW